MLIKNVVELTPKTIKNFLFLWHKNYFKHYNKKEIKVAKYEPKNKEKYLFNNWPKDSSKFKFFDGKINKAKVYKYKAEIEYDVKDNLTVEQRQVIDLNLSVFKDEIEKFVKSLGYENFSVVEGEIEFFGNKKELFEQKTLEENSKKVMKFIANKLKSLDEEELFKVVYYNFRNYDENIFKNLNLKDFSLWSEPNKYREFSISYFVTKSFNETGKAFSNKYFLINKNNEIENDYKTVYKYIKQNLNVYDILAEKGPKFINVFEQSDKTMEQTYKNEKEKYECLPRVVPIKLKDEKGKKFADDFAKLLFNSYLDEELNFKKGLIYGGPLYSSGIENKFLGVYKLNKDSVKPFEDYIFKNFNELMKNFKPTEKDLNEFKKQYKENYNSFKKEYEVYFENEKKIIGDLKSYIKTGKIDENSILHSNQDFKITELFNFIPNNLINGGILKLYTLCKDFKDYNEYFNIEMAFKEKYRKKSLEKITPEIAKEFLNEFFLPIIKKLKQAFKLAEEKLKALDSIKLKDVTDLTKTAYLVEDKNEIEKVNSNIKKREKRVERFREDVAKSLTLEQK